MFAIVKRVWRAISSVFGGADLGYGASALAPKPPADEEIERADRNFERLDAVKEILETARDVHDHPADAAHIIEHAGIGHMEGTPGVVIWDIEHGGADVVADVGGGLLGMVARVFRNVAMRVLLDRHGESEPAKPPLILTDVPKRSALRRTVSDRKVFGTDAPPPSGLT